MGSKPCTGIRTFSSTLLPTPPKLGLGTATHGTAIPRIRPREVARARIKAKEKTKEKVRVKAKEREKAKVKAKARIRVTKEEEKDPKASLPSILAV